MELVVLYGEREEPVHLERTARGYRVTLAGTPYDVDVAHPNVDLKSLLIEGRHYEVTVRTGGDGRYAVVSTAGLSTLELVDPLTHLARVTHGETGAAERQLVTAMMPGRVVRLLAGEGDEVEADSGVVVLEAMKMENEIPAGRAGRVVKLHVAEGQAVEGGDPLFEVE